MRDKLVRACQVDASDAELLLTEVIRFVNLAAHSSAELGQALTPSVMVDDGWHELILCTREYSQLCQTQFGRFVHHDPGGEEALNRSRFRDTLGLYALWFGTPDPRWWGPGAQSIVTADCGACQTLSHPESE